MTELQKLERAKMYIEKMANGINPIDDTLVSDNDLINNVRISRCLFYVADILNEVLENGGVTPPEQIYIKTGSVFRLSEEEKSQLSPSDIPLSVKQITDNINSLKSEQASVKLKTTSTGKWLEQIGMLETVTDDFGKNKKIPTEDGKAIGIFTEMKISQMGYPYYPVLYNKNAQQFIYDNIDAVIEENNIKRKKKKQN